RFWRCSRPAGDRSCSAREIWTASMNSPTRRLPCWALALATACSPREAPPAASEPEPPPAPAVERPAIYADERRSFEERAQDLVSRLTLEEKIRQLMHDAPAIERLGVPAY